MKKPAITLSILALVASSFGQVTKKQPISNLSRQYAGIYTLGDTDKNSEAPNGTVYIYPETDSTALFYLFKIRGAPSYNMGEIDGRITIHSGKAIFRERYNVFETDCILRFEFNDDILTVTEDDYGCPFGYGVYIQDTFLRTTSEIPQYYTSLDNEKVYFSSILALVASSYGQTTENYPTPSWADSTFYSNIRPNEALQLDTLYIDNFEYIGYNDDLFGFFIDVKKDDTILWLRNNNIHQIVSELNLNRGDMVKIQWKIDCLRAEWDKDLFRFTEHAVKITKTKDGKVSLFKKIYPKPIKYYYSESYYLDSFLDKIYRYVEYYLANSKQDLVKFAISDPKNSLIYSIEDKEKDDIAYYVIGIYSEFENRQSLIQWIYISIDFQKIFEYDLPNDELIEFE